MADVEFEVVKFALLTAAAGNTQDITTSGSWTPKAAIFFVGGTSISVSAYARMSLMWTDGTNQNSIGIEFACSQAPTTTARPNEKQKHSLSMLKG